MQGVPEIRHNFIGHPGGIPPPETWRTTPPVIRHHILRSPTGESPTAPAQRTPKDTARRSPPSPAADRQTEKRATAAPLRAASVVEKGDGAGREKGRHPGTRPPGSTGAPGPHVGTCLQIVRTRHTTEHTNARNHPLPAPSRTGSGKSGRTHPRKAARADTAQKIRSPRRDRTTSIRRAAHPLHDKRNPESP